MRFKRAEVEGRVEARILRRMFSTGRVGWRLMSSPSVSKRGVRHDRCWKNSLQGCNLESQSKTFISCVTAAVLLSACGGGIGRGWDSRQLLLSGMFAGTLADVFVTVTTALFVFVQSEGIPRFPTGGWRSRWRFHGSGRGTNDLRPSAGGRSRESHRKA